LYAVSAQLESPVASEANIIKSFSDEPLLSANSSQKVVNAISTSDQEIDPGSISDSDLLIQLSNLFASNKLENDSNEILDSDMSVNSEESQTMLNDQDIPRSSQTGVVRIPPNRNNQRLALPIQHVVTQRNSPKDQTSAPSTTSQSSIPQQSQPAATSTENSTESSQTEDNDTIESPLYEAEGFLADSDKNKVEYDFDTNSTDNTWTIVASVTGTLIFIGMVAVFIYKERQSRKSEMDLETKSHTSIYSDSNASDGDIHYRRPASTVISSLESSVPEITTANPYQDSLSETRYF